jgi:glyoxylase I family protein
MAISIKGLAPLLQVFDMPRSIAFYRNVLGFEVVGAAPDVSDDCFDWALLRRDGVELMLNTAYEEDARPQAPNPDRVSAHGDTGLYFGCPDVDGAYEHLKALQVEAELPRVAPYGMKQLYVTDPDGYVVCLQWPVEPARE